MSNHLTIEERMLRDALSRDRFQTRSNKILLWIELPIMALAIVATLVAIHLPS